MLDYYVKMKLAKRRLITEPMIVGNIKITAIPVGKGKSVSVFIFEENGRKVVYAPCDCKPFPLDNQMRNADVLIVGNTFIGDTLKGSRVIGDHHPLRQELHSMEDIMQIRDKLSINNVVITHIEEDWGKSYDDYLVLEKEYSGIKFAYDGMVIEV